MADPKWPTDTATKIHYASSIDLETLLGTIEDRWPDADTEDITITAANIQTRCFGHDVYDSGDYTDFIILERTNDTTNR